MKNYRLFVLGFMTASFILLTGFDKPGVHDVVSPAAKKTASNEAKKVQSKSKSKTKKTEHKQQEPLVPSAENSAVEQIEPQKPLDLSISFDDSENTWSTIEQSKAVQKESFNIFSSEKKKKARPLYLNGQMLMSQEFEGDKQQSVDGAGIVINLKR